MGFKILTADELIATLRKGGYRYKWSQIHHTWRPNHSNFNGKNHLALQQGMYDYHVHVRGWADIGQHVTLMPDGLFVTGRSFSKAPAGISGYNTGSFMVEMLGDFDNGQDKLEGNQLEAMLKLQHYLTSEAGATIMFHREHAPKTCPGTGLDKEWFCKAVKNCDVNTPLKVTKPNSQVGNDTVINYLNLGDKGASVKALQNKLMSLGYNLPKYGADGSFGKETDLAVKQFQKDHNLTADGIVGPATSKALGTATPKTTTPEPKDLPKVTSLGDTYAFRVKTKVDAGIYKYADLSQKERIIKAGTTFKVYGFTYASYAVGGGGFVQMKDVEEIPVTITTGGLNKKMEEEFRKFLKDSKIDGELNIYAKGNPSADINVKGIDIYKVRKFLDEKKWYYTIK